MRKKVKKVVQSESATLRACCEYLSLRKHLYWRSNNVGVFDVAGGFHRALPFGSMKGVPDINVIDKTGHYVGLEVKRVGGRQSPEQKIFEERCRKNGAEYHIIRSVDDLIEIGL